MDPFRIDDDAILLLERRSVDARSRDCGLELNPCGRDLVVLAPAANVDVAPYADVDDSSRALAAARITSTTRPGFVSMATWLLATS